MQAALLLFRELYSSAQRQCYTSDATNNGNTILASLPDSAKGKEMEIQSFRAPVYPVLTMFILVLVVLALAACGSNSDQGSASTTTHPAQSTPSPASQAVATSTPGATQGYCGSISRMLLGAKASPGQGDPQQVANCFWSAYQQCRPASFTYATGSVDTILTRTFQTQKSASGCLVQDKLQMRVLPRPPRTTAVYTCASVKMQASTLQFLNCQKDGTITLSLNKQ
ncbi:hypothetical protein [Dictyobacter formicarum]|uniref:Ig-like domain-containing protein n=1 Tax=Dictyobacter formicarum TaxID=2778368 RepID=A0ABQ3VPE3_9CHLR|nr:hypothetical protein [Dictyobacter formicarum]GHO87458.1 hypothetical protein KSZ_54640 [Dictyobacter formicarum]